MGLLIPLAMPTRPFEVITMDLIMELPMSKGFKAVLVIVDKLTKYGIFIPTTTSCTSTSVAQIVLEHDIAHYGLFNQVVSDRDGRWKSGFWKDLCTHLGIKRLLCTSYHPQTDGQTENLNQVLEMALRAYVGSDLSDWAEMLAPFSLSYNSLIHSTMGYSPAFLLQGFQPITPGSVLAGNENHPNMATMRFCSQQNPWRGLKSSTSSLLPFSP